MTAKVRGRKLCPGINDDVEFFPQVLHDVTDVRVEVEPFGGPRIGIGKLLGEHNALHVGGKDLLCLRRKSDVDADVVGVL